MDYDLYWNSDPTLVKAYLESYKLKTKREQEVLEWKMWKQGMYIYEALCDVSPVLHAFAKKGTKPLPYSKKPYGFEEEQTEIDQEQKLKNERLRAIATFNYLYRTTKKRFEK